MTAAKTIVVEVASAARLGDGGYVLTISVGTTEFELTADAARRYAASVMRTCAIAGYEAGVVRHAIEAVSMPVEFAGLVLGDLRDRRGPIDASQTRPLHFEPVLSATDHRPYLWLYLDGQRLVQVAPQWAAEHAANVLRIATCVEMDTAYLRTLMTQADLSEAEAHDIIAQLGEYLPAYTSDGAS